MKVSSDTVVAAIAVAAACVVPAAMEHLQGHHLSLRSETALYAVAFLGLPASLMLSGIAAVRAVANHRTESDVVISVASFAGALGMFVFYFCW